MSFVLVGFAVIVVLGASGALFTFFFLGYLQKLSKARLPKQSSSWVEVSDSKIHYRRDGEGPVLLLIHGLGASLFIWRLVVAELAKNFTVLTIDLPGFGLSSKDSSLEYGLDAQTKRVIEFLNALNVEEATIVGSSMGGALALWIAHEYPKRFRNVIAMAPATSPTLVPRLALPLKHAAPLFFRTLNTHTMKIIASRALYNKSLLTEETVNAYLRPYLEDRESVHTFWRAIELVRDRRLPSDLKSLKSRVLVLWGERDKVVPRRVMTELIDILPNAEFRTHNDCGHHPMEDQPEWVIAECERFLRVDQRLDRGAVD